MTVSLWISGLVVWAKISWEEFCVDLDWAHPGKCSHISWFCSGVWCVAGWSDEGQCAVCFLIVQEALWAPFHGWRGSRNIRGRVPVHKLVFEPLLMSHLLTSNWSRWDVWLKAIWESTTEGHGCREQNYCDFFFFLQTTYQKIINWNIAMLILCVAFSEILYIKHVINLWKEIYCQSFTWLFHDIVLKDSVIVRV